MVLCIEIGKLDRKVSFIIVLSITFFVKDFIYSKFGKQKNNAMEFITLIVVAKMLGGLVTFISFYFLSSKNDARVFFPKDEKCSIKPFIIIIVISFLEFLGMIVNYVPMSSYLTISPGLHNLFNVMGIIPKGFIIFFTCLACSFLLQYKLYNHKILSLVIIFIGIVIYTSSLLLWFYESHLEKIVTIEKNHRHLGITYTVFMFFVCITIAIQEVSEKYLLHYKFFNPFFILLFEGGIQMILLIGFIILFNFPFPSLFFSDRSWFVFTVVYTLNRMI